jgi:predicted DNA-binding mobile mystery protein A
MRRELRARVRRDLDEDLRVFRGRKVRRSRWGWLRGVRQALGMRVAEVAERMKVGNSEVYRLEMSEVRDTITLKKLRGAAEAMGCELVYAVVPLRGTLEELAEELEQQRQRRKRARPKRGPKTDPYGLERTLRTVLTLAGWHSGAGE